MSWKLRHRLGPAPRFLGSLAFRLTAWYVLAGLALVVLATSSLYFLLVTELQKSADLFLADKVNVLRTMLQERPDDWDAFVRKLNWSRPPEHISVSISDFWTKKTFHF